MHGDAASKVKDNLAKAATLHNQQFMGEKTRRMQARIMSAALSVFEYDSKELHAKALAVIPVEELKARAQKESMN